MPTTAKQACDERIIDLLSGEDGATWAKLLTECLRDFRIEEYPPSYVDMIFQKWERFKPTLEDAYNFLNIHTWIQLGQLAIFSIDIEEEPHRDKDISENNEALARLPEPYRAEFFGGTQDEDGYLEWKKSVHGTVSIRKKNEVYGCVIPPISLPLEVGTCESEKMFLYCNPSTGRGVARWPYYSKKIYVMTSVFAGSKDNLFKQMVRDTGEQYKDFAFDANRNPHLEWSRHQSKKSGGVSN